MATNSYRVVAQNTAGYTGAGGAFMTLTASSESETLTLAPAAARASVSPSSLAFGNVTIGTDPSPVQDVILTNVGTADLTVNSVSLPLGVFAQNGGCTVGTTLVTDASCTIRVTFTPNAAQYYTENLSIGTSDVALTVPLSGTGVAQASVPVATLSTASLDFVSVNVGATSAPQEVTLTSTGTAPLTVSSITASTGVFAQTNDCLTTSPLAPTATCTISVTFTPSLQQTSATQSYAGSLSIGTNDPVNGTQSVSLTGIGDWLPPAAPTNLTGSATRLAQGPRIATPSIR
jgi:hypothetical protein